MRKNIISGIVVIMAAIGVLVVVNFSQNKTTIREDAQEVTTETQPELTNPASEIGEGEVRLTEENFNAEIRDFKGIALVDMFSPSCGYCQQLGPIVSEVAKESQGKYKVGKLNVILSPDIADEYMVDSYPILIVFKDGKEVSRMVGVKPKETILANLEEYLND